MPLYEYRCDQCQRKFTHLCLSANILTSVTCSYCASARVTKLMSTIAVHRSEAARLAELDVRRPQGDDFYRDRNNIGLQAKQRLQREGIQPDAHFEEVVEKARTEKFLTEG
jgi:putative FmdB family regulatory protein